MCHGPNQQAGLRLETRDGAFADRGGFQLIAPGKAADSRLFQRISGLEEAMRMRFRLPAEMVRDNALAVSGLLNSEIRGPSVSPYQPEGLWEEMGRP